MKNPKTFEVIFNKKSHFVTANTKKQVRDFFLKEKPKKIIERRDIDFVENFNL